MQCPQGIAISSYISCDFLMNTVAAAAAATKSLQSCPTLCDPRGAHQAPPSLGFSRQEHWSGLPFPSPGDPPDPGVKPGSPALQADSLPSLPRGHNSAPNSLEKDLEKASTVKWWETKSMWPHSGKGGGVHRRPGNWDTDAENRGLKQ